MLGNSGLKREQCARGRHVFLSTRVSLTFARLFFSAPKYFQAPATQAMFTKTMLFNLVPRALFPGFGGGLSPTSKAREKCPGNEVGCCPGNNGQQSIVSFFFSFLLPMPYTPKALIKTFLKSKVVEFSDTVDLRCLADRCYFCVCNHT